MLLDPDPHSQYRSGSKTANEFGSRWIRLHNTEETSTCDGRRFNHEQQELIQDQWHEGYQRIRPGLAHILIIETLIIKQI
jgi:hypothetical protein